MIGKNPGMQILKQVIPALAVLAVDKLLAVPRVRDALKDVDREAAKKKRVAFRAVRSAGKNAAKNNKALLGASAAAFAVGIGLLARAGTKR